MPTDFIGGGRAPSRRTTGPRRLLNEAPRADFTYKHHPARWQEVDGELLPVLSRMSHARGVNNVDHYGDTTRAEVDAQKGGWTLIPQSACPAEITPDGIAGYVRVFDGRAGPIHVSAWTHPRSVGSKVTWVVDEEGYRAFLRHLMAEGYIDAPDPAIVDMLREQLMSSRQRSAGRADLNTYAARDVERIDAALDRLDAAWNKVDGTPAPEPKPRATRKRSKA
jgi:hypothetical protein